MIVPSRFVPDERHAPGRVTLNVIRNRHETEKYIRISPFRACLMPKSAASFIKELVRFPKMEQQFLIFFRIHIIFCN